MNSCMIKILIFIFLFQGCVPEFKPTLKDRLFLKEIEKPPVKLEWYFYSTVSSETPDYITIEKGGVIDTICLSNNIADLKFENNQITIGFYGVPQRYTEPIEIPDSVMGYEILIDTTYTTHSLTAPRKFYKREGK